MSKVKSRKPAPAPADVYDTGTQISSVIFGLVMVVAIIVAGAALLGGSLSKAGQRWASAMDGVSRSIGLSVDQVYIYGLENAPMVERQIRVAAMIEPGENIFRADPHQIRRRIEGTKMVTHVRVYRYWPDTVQIYAYAAEPVALWHNGADWTVVDSMGRVMPRHRPGDYLDLIKTSGQGGPEAVPALHKGLAAVPHVARQIAYATRKSGRRWDLVLKNGAIVKLPNDETLLSGIETLAVLEKSSALMQRPLESIDLRVAGKVYLTAKTIQPVKEAA